MFDKDVYLLLLNEVIENYSFLAYSAFYIKHFKRKSVLVAEIKPYSCCLYSRETEKTSDKILIFAFINPEQGGQGWPLCLKFV